MIENSVCRTRAWARFTGLLLAASFILPLHAQNSVVLTPSRDNTMYEDGGGILSNGAGQYFFAGNSGIGLSRRALLAFEVAGTLPDGVAIDSVRLKLIMSRTISGPVTLSLHRLTGNWGEGASAAPGEEGSGGPALDNDATWTHAFYDSLAWNTAGGDFVEDASAVFEIDSTGAYTISSTAGMVADVQHWVTAPGENFGWILVGDESGTANAKRFNSRQNADTTTVPMLEVFYSLPTARAQPDLPALLLDATSYPNPFQDRTTISFSLSRPAHTYLSIYDVLGRKVKTLIGHPLPAGRFSVDFDASNLPAGAYFYQLDAGRERLSKMVILRR